MKGTSSSQADRVKRWSATKCHDGKCGSLINSLGRGSPWPFSSSASISPRTCLPSTAWAPQGSRSWFARACGARSCWSSLPRYRPAPSAWKRVQAHTTGHASSSSTVTPCGPSHRAPYRLSGRRGKNDAADAAAICEAVQRPCASCRSRAQQQDTPVRNLAPWSTRISVGFGWHCTDQLAGRITRHGASLLELWGSPWRPS